MNEKQGLLSEIKQPLTGVQIFFTLISYVIIVISKYSVEIIGADFTLVGTIFLPWIWGFVVMSRSQSLIARTSVIGTSTFAILYFAIKCTLALLAGYIFFAIYSVKLLIMVIIGIITLIKNNKASKENENNEITENI